MRLTVKVCDDYGHIQNSLRWQLHLKVANTLLFIISGSNSAIKVVIHQMTLFTATTIGCWMVLL